MKNELISEIRHTRDELARETGYELKRLFDYVHQRERNAAQRGVKFVSFVKDEQEESSGVLRAERPKR